MCPRVTSPFSPAPVQSEKREWLASLTVWRVVRDRFQRTGDVSANNASPREHCRDDLTMS